MLVTLMLIPNTMVFATSSQTDDEQLAENIIAIENELKDCGTDVETELINMIDEYKNILSDATNDADVSNVENLILTLEEMLSEYQMYKIGVLPYKFHVIYSPAVSAVIAYFNSQGYSLAAELLTHAKNNTSLNSNYFPVNGSIVKNSSVFKSIANGTKTSGSSRFNNVGGKIDKDLYYAIHNFDFTKSSPSSKIVRLCDRYDFAPGDYSGIAGIAVDTMYKAQQAGVIVPYYVNIIATL